MDIMVESLPPGASLAQVEYAIVKQRRRLLPVVENGNIIGIITRTDLLQTLLDNPELPEFSPYALEDMDEERTRNVQSVLQERLPRHIIEILRQMGSLADEMEAKAYLVGGGVRDILMRRDNIDLDVVIEGDAVEFARHFVRAAAKARLKINKKFRTAKLIFDNDLEIDLASSRVEFYQAPAVLPEVKMSSIKLDLYRRDFTMNALAIHLNPGQYGGLVDFFDGLHDIKEGVIRVLHNLSFVEDPTRIFRAIRFEQRLNFKLSRQTEALIKNAIKLEVLDKLSGDRLGQELRLTLAGSEPAACLKRLSEIRALAYFHPALKIDQAVSQLLQAQEKVYNWYRLSFLDEPIRLWLYFGMGLCSRLDPKQMAELAARVKLAPKRLEEILEARARSLEALYHLQKNGVKPSRAYDLLNNLKLEYQLFIMAGSRQQEVKRAVSAYLTVWRKIKSQLNGNDLKAMGFAPGPQMSVIKQRLLAARLDGEVKNYEQEKKLVQREFQP
jgi:tRNA nucleotidyltransferase (CCA-adding enzyme)